MKTHKTHQEIHEAIEALRAMPFESHHAFGQWSAILHALNDRIDDLHQRLHDLGAFYRATQGQPKDP